MILSWLARVWSSGVFRLSSINGHEYWIQWGWVQHPRSISKYWVLQKSAMDPALVVVALIDDDKLVVEMLEWWSWSLLQRKGHKSLPTVSSALCLSFRENTRQHVSSAETIVCRSFVLAYMTLKLPSRYPSEYREIAANQRALSPPWRAPQLIAALWPHICDILNGTMQSPHRLRECTHALGFSPA